MKRVYSKVTRTIAGVIRWSIAVVLATIAAIPGIVALYESA
jgi:hypothetical protein